MQSAFAAVTRASTAGGRAASALPGEAEGRGRLLKNLLKEPTNPLLPSRGQSRTGGLNPKPPGGAGGRPSLPSPQADLDGEDAGGRLDAVARWPRGARRSPVALGVPGGPGGAR